MLVWPVRQGNQLANTGSPYQLAKQVFKDLVAVSKSEPLLLMCSQGFHAGKRGREKPTSTAPPGPPPSWQQCITNVFAEQMHTLLAATVVNFVERSRELSSKDCVVTCTLQLQNTVS